MTDPIRKHCAEILQLWDADCDLDSAMEHLRGLITQPEPPAEGEVGELGKWLRELGAKRGGVFDLSTFCANLDRAADLLGQRHPASVAVSERLPELRGMFERILCVARSSGNRPVGNIELAGRLIKAVVSWAALPLPAGEVE